MAAKRSFWGSPHTRTVIAAALYLGVVAGVMALADTGFEDWFLIWLAATFILGWTTRNPWLALLPLLAVSIAMPFVHAGLDGESEPLPIWFVVGYLAALFALIVLAGWGGRKLYDRLRASRARSTGGVNRFFWQRFK